MKKTYYKPLVITISVIALDIIFGFDAKFTIINMIWLIPFKTSYEKNIGSVHRK